MLNRPNKKRRNQVEKSLVCITAYSNKFWKIKAQGNVFIVLYGKIGSGGSVNTKEFPSEELCLKEAYKLIDSKLKKGYRESDQEGEWSNRFSQKLDNLK
nr:WGR domain-containing protein [Planococcus halocryophilus]